MPPTCNIFYHINYGVVQAFPAPRKAVTTHVKKYDIFSCVFDIASQLLTRHSRHSVRLMNEQQSCHHSMSAVVVFQNILGLWLLKRWKIRTAYRQWRSNFLRRGENQNAKRKTESYVFSDFYTGISRGWEWKSTTGIFATGRFWPWTWKISSVAKDKVGNWEFCVLKLGPLLFLYLFNAFFIFGLSANSLYNF